MRWSRGGEVRSDAGAEGTAEGLRGGLEYARDLFEAGDDRADGGHFRRVLEQMVEDPQQKINELTLLTERRAAAGAQGVEPDGAEYPQGCVHELFEEQVARTPEAVAVVYEDERLTYGELNRRANQLGHYLRKLGVGPEVRVGIVWSARWRW